MIIVVKNTTNNEDIPLIKEELSALNLSYKVTIDDPYTLIHILGDTTSKDATRWYAYESVQKVIRIHEPYIKVLKTPEHKTNIILDGVSLFEPEKLIIAGPCSVESKTQINQIAAFIKAAGAKVLRGGAYKPRTSPYAFQGLKEEGLKLLHEAGKNHGLFTISEIIDKEDLPLFLNNVDIIQVGARNMQNFSLLKALGKTNKPILLKRGFGNTIEEWLMSAEYILNEGNKNVILCERGIRTFESFSRSTLDIAAILAVKKLSHLPVITDPSHAAGSYDLVEGLTLASIAAGADGVMIEVHPDPLRALSDGAQSLKLEKFKALILKVRQLENL
ncbi:MAG: 3-deoxy-7-phosphoheptulonate synthase [Candidatus Izemoplasmataceae bacterium]